MNRHYPKSNSNRQTIEQGTRGIFQGIIETKTIINEGLVKDNQAPQSLASGFPIESRNPNKTRHFCTSSIFRSTYLT